MEKRIELEKRGRRPNQVNDLLNHKLIISVYDIRFNYFFLKLICSNNLYFMEMYNFFCIV